MDSKPHEGLPVPGYRPQSDNNVTLVSKNKIIEEQLLRTLDALSGHPDFDKRWLAIARTHFEEGFMAMNRAIFRPSRIKLPSDDAAEAKK